MFSKDVEICGPKYQEALTHNEGSLGTYTYILCTGKNAKMKTIAVYYKDDILPAIRKALGKELKLMDSKTLSKIRKRFPMMGDLTYGTENFFITTPLFQYHGDVPEVRVQNLRLLQSSLRFENE